GDGTAHRVAGTIYLDADAVGQRDAAETGTDQIAHHKIAAGAAVDFHTITVAIAEDEIGCPGGSAADCVVVAADLDAVGLVARDSVAQHEIAAASDQQAIANIAGEIVACQAGSAADRVVAAVHLDAVAAVARDQVAQDESAAAAAGDQQAIAGVVGEKVACAGGGAADGVAAAALHIDAVVLVRHCGGAGGVRADEIAQHLIIAAVDI